MIERLLFLCEKYPLDFISHLGSSLPVIAGLLRFKYLSSSLIGVVFLFLFYFVKETVSLWLSVLVKNNLYIQNIDAFFSILLIGCIYYFAFADFSYRKIIITFTSICLIVSIIFYKNFYVSSISLSVFRLFSIIISLAYFNKILSDMRVRSIAKHSMFWFSSGLLIYSTGTFFIFLFANYIYDINSTSDSTFDFYWNVSQVVFIVFILLSAYGLWVSKHDRENLI